jgi:mRNA-degrading endonuclease RelE of RelBE toxin-antitoxin system
MRAKLPERANSRRSSYRLVYEIDGDTIWILTLVHTKRQWPPLRD